MTIAVGRIIPAIAASSGGIQGTTKLGE